MNPSAGTKVAVDKQPLTLTVANADTNGVRPLSYGFDVATDVNFTSKVFSRSGVAPGDGQTSLRLPDALAPERTYYWRAHAEDGANTGSFSAAVNFDVFTPIVIQAPRPIAPAANAVTDSTQPALVVANAAHTGPVGPITYQAEVADSDSFANKVAAWTSAEGSGQTTLSVPTDLGFARTLYWHVRAIDPTTVGPYSPTMAFTTPSKPVSGPGPGGPVGGCGGTSDDVLCHAIVLSSPSNLASWPATSRITSVTFQPDGFPVEFDKRTGPGAWPDSPFGDGGGGTIQYTLGMCLNIGGQWYCSSVVQFWSGRSLLATGPPSLVATNWFYDPARWAPMTGHQPADGEIVGIFAVAGNTRGNDGSFSLVKERTNVALVPFNR
jgi:hypothetical protein